MSQKFMDRLKKAGLSPRSEKIILLDPGVLFGFASPDLEKMIQRIDCRDCQYITEVTAELLECLVDIDKRSAEIITSVRRENEILNKSLGWWSKLPFIGRFFKPPEPVPVPDYKQEAWYKRAMEAVDQKEGALKLLKLLHPVHWGSEEEAKISRETIGRLLGV